ncbi:docking protein 2 [Biomphalaria glabrata]|nr:docking protein 2 [Biomphalaria glabrata]
MEVFAGRMTVKVPSFFGQRTYENVWCVLHACPEPKYVRMHIYNDENTKPRPREIILLDKAKWKKLGNVELGFGLELKGNKLHTFKVNSREDLRKWILSLCIVSFDLFKTKSEVGVEDTGKVDLDSLLTRDSSAVEMNVLYGSSLNPTMHYFFVAIKQDSDFPKLNMSGLYKMIIHEENIYICNLDSDDVVVAWSLFEIKKYGYNSCFFYLLAGAKAESREGNYGVYTAVGEKIKDLLLTEANKLREIYKDEIARNMAEMGASASTDDVSIEIHQSASEGSSDVYSQVDKSKSVSQTHLVASAKQQSSKRKTEKEKKTKDVSKKDKEKSKNKTKDVKEEKHYADPWENKPKPAVSKKPAKVPPGFHVDKDVYAEPDKLKKGLSITKSREVVHTENYEPAPLKKPEIIPPRWEPQQDDLNANDTYAHINRAAPEPVSHDNIYGMQSASAPIKPKIIPPKWETKGDDSNNNDTYAHITRTAAKASSHDNIYGLESASAPIKPPHLPEPDNPYEDTGPSTSAYEAVQY